MKKAILILIISVFSFLYYMGFFTQRETLPFFTAESSSPVERVWEVKKISEMSKIELDQLYQTKLDKGIRNLPTFSYFLIREASRARNSGNIQRAIELANASIKFSPELPQPYFELAKLLWHQNHFQLDPILSAFYKGFMAQFHYFPSAFNFCYECFYIFSNAILLTLMIFGLVVMIKYLPLYFNVIRKHLVQGVSSFIINGLKILILGIPFFLRLDLLWAILFWCILLWGYTAKREKTILIIFLVLLVYFPFFLRSISSYIETPLLNIALKIHRANYEDWDKTTKEALQTWASDHPEDIEVLLTLGLIEKRQGQYSQAEEFYKRALQQNPHFSEALSNLGNVYLAQKKIQLAIATYHQAVDLNPNQGAYYYNLFRAYSQETFLSEQKDKYFQKARQLAPHLVGYYLEIESPHINRQVIDEIVNSSRLRKRFFAPFVEKEGWLIWLFKGWFIKIPSRLPLLVPLIFLGFLIGMSSYVHTKRFLTRCPMCGVATYRLYSGGSEREYFCFNCHRIFLQKEKLHPRITEKKFQQVNQFQKQNQLITKLCSLLLVGFGYLWRESYLKGLALLLIFFVFILRFIYWNGVIPSPFPPTSSSFWRIVFWEGLFLIFYLIVLWQIFHLRPKFETPLTSLSQEGEKRS